MWFFLSGYTSRTYYLLQIGTQELRAASPQELIFTLINPLAGKKNEPWKWARSASVWKWAYSPCKLFSSKMRLSREEEDHECCVEQTSWVLQKVNLYNSLNAGEGAPLRRKNKQKVRRRTSPPWSFGKLLKVPNRLISIWASLLSRVGQTESLSSLFATVTTASVVSNFPFQLGCRRWRWMFISVTIQRLSG